MDFENIYSKMKSAFRFLALYFVLVIRLYCCNRLGDLYKISYVSYAECGAACTSSALLPKMADLCAFRNIFFNEIFGKTNRLCVKAKVK